MVVRTNQFRCRGCGADWRSPSGMTRALARGTPTRESRIADAAACSGKCQTQVLAISRAFCAEESAMNFMFRRRRTTASR